jgi:hypothetical protein
MTSNDKQFYERTHPGFGSFWSDKQQQCIYYKKNPMRSGDELPLGKNTDLVDNIRIGLNPDILDNLVLVLIPCNK